MTVVIMEDRQSTLRGMSCWELQSWVQRGDMICDACALADAVVASFRSKILILLNEHCQARRLFGPCLSDTEGATLFEKYTTSAWCDSNYANLRTRSNMWQTCSSCRLLVHQATKHAQRASSAECYETSALADQASKYSCSHSV